MKVLFTLPFFDYRFRH